MEKFKIGKAVSINYTNASGNIGMVATITKIEGNIITVDCQGIKTHIDTARSLIRQRGDANFFRPVDFSFRIIEG